MAQNKWELKSHSYPIADTGDYDGHWEITDGKTSLCTKDDPADERLEDIVKALNATECKFYVNNDDEVVNLQLENYQLKDDYAALRAKVEKMEQALKELLIVRNIKLRNGKTDEYLKLQPIAWNNAHKALEHPAEKEFVIEYTTGIPQSRLLAEKFFDEELAKTTDVARRHEVSQEKETWIGCFIAGYNAHTEPEKEPVPQQGAVWVTGQYDRLYDQLKAEPKRKIVCWVNYDWGRKGDPNDLCRDICAIMGKVMGFNARGIGYGGAEIWIGEECERAEFLKECERLHVQWLDEQAGREVTEEDKFTKWVKENATILGESHWLVGMKHIRSKSDLLRVYNYLTQKEVKPGTKLEPGTKFRNIHMPGYTFIVRDILKPANILSVLIVDDLDDTIQRVERDWNLQHTLWAFEKNEYILEKEVGNG